MRSLFNRCGWRGGPWLLVVLILGGHAFADGPDDVRLLQRPGQAPEQTEPVPSTAASPSPAQDWRHWALGVNYLGGQMRWRPSARWAFEAAYQQDKASSDYGDVTARVFSLRSYRFFRPRHRWSLYAGPELAYTTAKPQTSDYSTTGVVAGAFMGSELNITRRFALDVDIGPYVISLKERETGLSQTNLDFVIQTALLFNLFC